MSERSDGEILQAFLEGRLTPGEEADVVARLKSEPALADALLALAREEAVLSEWARKGPAQARAAREERAIRRRPPEARLRASERRPRRGR